MRRSLIRAGMGAVVAGAFIVVSCGSENNKTKVRSEAIGGEGGGGDTSLPVGGAPDSASAGSSARTSAGEGGASEMSSQAGQAGAGEAGAGLGGTGAGEGGAGSGGTGAGEAGAAGSEAGAGGSPDSGPVVTVDADCLPPATTQRLSPVAAGLPADGLSLWLRADRGVYATDQHRVCAWVDQSSNDYVFYATGQNRPLWAESSVGSQPAVDFDATDRTLSVGHVLGIPATAGRTLIAVVQLVNTSGRFGAIMQGQGNTAGTYLTLDANTFQTAGSREGVYVTNNSYDSSLATSSSPRVHLFTIGSMAPGTAVLDTVDYRVNGTGLTLTRNPGGLGNGNVEDFSQANFTLLGRGSGAYIAEAIVYGRTLTLEERSAVETALKARYGIP